jgi:hypothetical protein
MKSDKRYSNETFNKRVDHEAGKHRPPRAAAEPAVCADCGNVYADRRWSKPDVTGAHDKHTHFRAVQTVICPACQAMRSGVPSGYVHLSGSFFLTHRAEVERLLSNEAGRAETDNPLARIMGWEEDKNGAMIVKTTTEHLAQRLGHALEKAFKGAVRYDFSHENKLAHVWWQRDEARR